MHLNKVCLLGNMGRDPEIRSTQSGGSVANLSVATSESWKDKNSGERKERTEWHRVVVWGPQADNCGRHLRKGDRVYLEGKLETRKWTDQSGQDRYSTEIVLRGYDSKVIFLGGKESHPNQDGAGGPDLGDDIPF